MGDTGGELFERWLAHRNGLPEPQASGAHVAERDDVAPDGDDASPGPVVAHGPDSTAAGAAVLAALSVTQQDEAAGEALADQEASAAMAAAVDPVELTLPPVNPVVAGAPPAPVPPVQVVAPTETSGPSEATLAAVRQVRERAAGKQNVTVPRDYAFKPCRATRTTLTTVFFGWLLASLAMCLASYEDRSQTTYIVTGLVVLLAAVTWAVRAGATVARLRVVGGILQVERAGRTEVFSLIDDYQVIEVVGRPGGLNWQVQFRRPGLDPYVVDASMVNAKEFMQVLGYYRPGVRAVR